MMDIQEYEPRGGWLAHYRRQKIGQVARLVVGAFVIGSFPFFYMVACWLDQL